MSPTKMAAILSSGDELMIGRDVYTFDSSSNNHRPVGMVVADGLEHNFQQDIWWNLSITTT